MSGFDIEEFKARNASGFSRDSFFLLRIQKPSFWQGDTEFLTYLCSSTQLPGMAALTQPVARWGYGPVKKVPYGMVHSDINLSVYSDGNGNAIDFFDQWQRAVTSFGSTNSADANGTMYGELAYPGWYETRVQIMYYSEVGNELLEYTLTEAYPIGMGEIPVSWASAGNIATITVPITYKTYQVNHKSTDSGIDNFAGVAVYTNAMSALFNAQAITSGFIGMNGKSISFSAALQLLNLAGIDIGSKIEIVGGIANSLNNIHF